MKKMTLSLFLGFLLLLGVCLPQANSLGQTGPEKGGLKAYQWQNRIILLFASSGQHPAFQEQQRIFRDQTPAFAERDLVLLEVLGDQSVKMKKGEESAASLRERYRVAPNEFTLLLIGKDGGEKFRSTTPVAPERIYDIIDAMPMRRSEMRENK
jgi:hypothetical protein